PLPARTVVFGEVGLGGEVRGVGQPDTRLREAANLGFERALIPARTGKSKGKAGASSLHATEICQLGDLFAQFDVTQASNVIARV
ncbi:MAG: DNA repair protein RadA, partial [Alphaproteobacteria bacterium]